MSLKPIDPFKIAKDYDRWSRTYDQMPNSTIAADELAFPVQWHDVRDMRVLEIGCGTGRHTRRLVAQGNHVTAIDVSAGMLSVARVEPALCNVEFIQSDIFDFKIVPGQEFDVIIASLVLEHIESLQEFFRKVHILLREGGRGFFSEIHPERTKLGSGARFYDDDGLEVRLESIAHTENDFIEATADAGLTLLAKHDVTGSAELCQMHDEWKKYLDRPMLQIWKVGK